MTNDDGDADAAATTDDDDLPPRDDPYWDDLTAETFTYLRRLRAAERRRRLGSTAYSAYVVLVIVVLYVVPYVWYALTRPSPAAAPQTAPVWALGATGLALLAVVAFLRDGAWRGPAVVDRPTAAWLLPSPTHRRALLLPRWRTALAVAAAAGALLGGLLGVVARVVSGGDALVVAASGALGALLLGAGGTATSALAETGRPALRRPTLLWLVPTAVLALAVLSTRTGGSTGVRSADYLPDQPSGAWTVVAAVLLWSGPWGWAVQPLVAALPGRAPGGVDGLWPVGALLTVVVAAVLVRAADRAVPTIDARTLRGRADSVALVGAAILSLQPRRARLTVLAAQGHAPSTRVRLRVPRRRVLLPLWRDATALLRAPARIVWSLLWLVVAVALLGEALRPRLLLDPAAAAGAGRAALDRAARGERLLLGVPGYVALYLAAAQLAEPARLDADDVRRLRIQPTAATRQALAHAVVPVLLLGAVCGAAWAVLAGGPFGATGFGWFSYAPLDAGSPLPDEVGSIFAGGPGAVLGWHAGVVAALVAMPLMVFASLVSAYRGEVPLTLLASGAGSPMGDPGPGALLAWYARAPLVAVLLLLPGLLGWGVAGTVTAVGTAGFITWAGTRAEAMLRA